MIYIYIIVIAITGYQIYKVYEKTNRRRHAKEKQIVTVDTPKVSTFEAFHVNPNKEEPTGVTLQRFIDEWNKLGAIKQGPTREGKCQAFIKNSRTKLFTLSGKIGYLDYSNGSWGLGLIFDLPNILNDVDQNLAAYIVSEEIIPTKNTDGYEYNDYANDWDDGMCHILLRDQFKDNEGTEFMKHIETYDVGDSINLSGYPVVPRDDRRKYDPIEFHIRSFEVKGISWEYLGDASMGKWRKIV